MSRSSKSRSSNESPEQAELLRRFQDEITAMTPGDLALQVRLTGLARRSVHRRLAGEHH